MLCKICVEPVSCPVYFTGEFMSTDQARAHPPPIHAALAEKQCQPDAVLEHIDEGADLIVGMFNSEPLTHLDTLEANAERLSGARIHQMFPSRERDYMHGAFPGSTMSPGSFPPPIVRHSAKTLAILYPTTSARYRP